MKAKNKENIQQVKDAICVIRESADDFVDNELFDCEDRFFTDKAYSYRFAEYAMEELDDNAVKNVEDRISKEIKKEKEAYEEYEKEEEDEQEEYEKCREENHTEEEEFWK